MLKNSVRDKFKLDSSYIESAIIGLWKINVISLIKTKASITKEFHISPNEIDKMVYWEYEMFLDALNDQIKETNEQQQGEMDKYDINKYQKMTQNPQKLMPKIPNMNINMPKF